MLAVVKKPHTNIMLFEVKGNIPSQVLNYLQQQFGKDIEIIEDEEEFINIFETDWYKQINSALTPGDAIKVYRENYGLSQTELAQKLGNLTKDFIIELESNQRKISQEMAKKLGQLFKVPVDRFYLSTSKNLNQEN